MSAALRKAGFVHVRTNEAIAKPLASGLDCAIGGADRPGVPFGTCGSFVQAGPKPLDKSKKPTGGTSRKLEELT